jgi:hypothetical protein
LGGRRADEKGQAVREGFVGAKGSFRMILQKPWSYCYLSPRVENEKNEGSSQMIEREESEGEGREKWATRLLCPSTTHTNASCIAVEINKE